MVNSFRFTFSRLTSRFIGTHLARKPRDYCKHLKELEVLNVLAVYLAAIFEWLEEQA
jgi:hypothetical protein